MHHWCILSLPILWEAFLSQEEYYDWVNGYNDENGNWVDGYEVITVIPGYTVDYHTGHRFSITCGFNLNK